jgi:amino acid permease
MLGRLTANTDNNSYFALGKRAFGTTGEIICMMSLVLFLMGALIFYLDLAAGFVLQFCQFVRTPVRLSSEPSAWYENKQLMTVFISLVTFPLACLRDMSSLGKASILGMICMSYILILTVLDCIFDSIGRSTTQSPAFAAVTPSVFASCFSSLLFAFVNHFTMVSVVPSLIDPTPKRRAQLTLGSAIFVYAFYAIIGLAGYIHFGTAVPKQILEATGGSMGAVTKWAYSIGKILMAQVLIISYPLLLDPARGTIEGALAIFCQRLPGWDKTRLIRHVLLTVSMVAGCALIAIKFPTEADTINQATTAFSGSLMVFILPSAFFLKLRKHYRTHFAETIAAWFNIVFGLAFMVGGTYFSVSTLLS